MSFLKLGALGFGGPLSLVALMHKEFVLQKKWMLEEEFNQAFTLIKAMPGTLAFQTGTYIGYRRGGFLGAICAGIGLILPAFLLMVLFAEFYYLSEQISAIRHFFEGMQIVAIVLIAQALINLIKPYFRHLHFWIIFCIAAILFYQKTLPEPVLIIGAAVLYCWWRDRRSKNNLSAVGIFTFASIGLQTAAASPVLWDLFWTCFKAGAFVFGTGIAIVPMLENTVVDQMGWLNHKEFLDALALGQITPGPVLITVTFIGYKVAGIFGAVLCTLGVFLAGFIHMVSWFPRMMKKLSQVRWIKDFVLAALAVVCGTILVTIFKLIQPWAETPKNYFVMIIFLGINLYYKRIPSWSLLLSGGALYFFIG